MTHEFLHHFHILPVRHQHGRKAVSERVPADMLPNPRTGSRRAHHTRKKDVGPVRVSSSTVRTRKYPIIRLAVRAVLLPGPELWSQSQIQRHRFSGRLGLAIAHNIQVDRTPHIDLQSFKLNVFPLECEELAASQSGGCIQKNHYTKAVIELGKQHSQFFRFQVLWDALPFSTLADKKDGVLALLQPLMPDSMIKEHAHQIADLRLGRGGERTAVCTHQLTKPLFYSRCANGPDVQAAPRRPDPSREKVPIYSPGGVGLPSV